MNSSLLRYLRIEGIGKWFKETLFCVVLRLEDVIDYNFVSSDRDTILIYCLSMVLNLNDNYFYHLFLPLCLYCFYLAVIYK